MTGTISNKQNQGLLLVQKPRILRAQVRSTKRRFVRFGNTSNCTNSVSDLHRIQKVDFELVQRGNGPSVRPKERRLAKDSELTESSKPIKIDIDLKLLQRRHWRRILMLLDLSTKKFKIKIRNCILVAVIAQKLVVKKTTVNVIEKVLVVLDCVDVKIAKTNT